MQSETEPETERDRLLDAILEHVIFDGWSCAALQAGARDLGLDDDALRGWFEHPIEAALAYHRRGDARMRARLAAETNWPRRYRDRVAHAVRLRLELADRNLVRHGMALMALPQHAARGAEALWQTASHIWEALGDTSRDVNWYTKRATLSGVYGSTVLYWLGDESEGQAETWTFLDRRIDDVMQIERTKARLRESPLGRALARGPGKLLEAIHAPEPHRPGYPGWQREEPK